jgi:hypothetical protein
MLSRSARKLGQHLGEIGQALDRDHARPALYAGSEGIAENPRAGLPANAPGDLEALCAEHGVAAQQDRALAAIGQQLLRQRHGIGRNRRRSGHGKRRRDRVRIAPGRIGGQD